MYARTINPVLVSIAYYYTDYAIYHEGSYNDFYVVRIDPRLTPAVTGATDGTMADVPSTTLITSSKCLNKSV